MANKKIIITGSGGISAGVISALIERNEDVFILGGTETEAEALKNRFPRIIGFECIDLRDESQTITGFEKAAAALGKITDVISIVGGSGRKFGDGQIHEISKDAWMQTIDLNLNTAFLTSREAIKYFLSGEGGSLTLTSSLLATDPAPKYFASHAYASAKAGINGLVNTLSANYLKNGIRVNAVAPAVVATPMALRAASDKEISDYIYVKQPLAKGQIKVDNIVPAYLFLLYNDVVTGEIINVDGGWGSKHE